ncbi:MAG: hypothetical protein RIT28_3626 [Pseudomonadota bacterium]
MLILSLTTLMGCGLFSDDPAPEAVKPKARPSLVLVTLDTTRADRLGAYGYAQAHTPNLDKLAQEGAIFDRAYAVVPLTTPSHSSMLTGLYPTRHGVRTNGDATLPQGLTTLAELLKGEGYRTAASVSAFVTTRMWGLDQGFDAYFDSIPVKEDARARWGQERAADAVMADAIQWVREGGDEPFFLWVHLYDVHEPYAPPAEWAEKLKGRPYDGEIAFVDDQIGRLRAAVEAKAPGNVAWIAVADHGEALGDHDKEKSHGLFLYDSTMRIPFIVRPAEALPAPVVVKNVTVSNVDVMPTALGLLGLAAPKDIDGADLTPAVRGEAMARSAVYMESLTASQRFGYHPEVAVAEGSLKLMDTPNPRLFDLSVDPHENTNLVASRPDDVKRLQAVSEAILSATVARDVGGGVPAEVVEQLAALGYIGAGAAIDPKFDSTVDAKDKQSTIDALEKARVLSQRPETFAEAEALYREILKAEPQLGEARLSLAMTLERRGKPDEAIGLLREAVRLTPDSTVLHTNLAAMLARQGRFDEALIEMEAALALVPQDAQTRVGVMRMLAAQKRHEDALARGQAWLAEGGNQPGVQGMVGLLLAQQGRVEEAEPLLKASLSDGQPQPRVHEMLARIATRKGDAAAVEPHLRAELDRYPMNHAARWAQANILMERKSWDEAAAEYRFMAEADAEQHNARVMWAQAVFNTADYEQAAQILAPTLAAQPKNPRAMMLHANILAKTGKKEQGEPIAKEAQALFAAEIEAKKAARPGTGGSADVFQGAPEQDDAADAGKVAPNLLPELPKAPKTP